MSNSFDYVKKKIQIIHVCFLMWIIPLRYYILLFAALSCVRSAVNWGNWERVRLTAALFSQEK